MESKQSQFFTFGRMETGTPLINEYFGSHQWINYGINNDFPQELIRIYQNSSTLHSNLINRKVDMIAGNGFMEATPFVMNEFSKDTLNEIVRKVAFDKVLFGGFYLNIIWNLDGTQVVQVEHLPFEKMRIAKYDCDEVRNSNELEGFYFSKDWLMYRRGENKPMFMPDYHQNLNRLEMTREEFNKQFPSQVMFFKTYSPGLDYYTLPSYNAALNWLKLDYEISTYHLKNVQNGLMPGMIIVNKSGIPTAEERALDEVAIRKRFAGADNAGDFIMVYAENGDKAPDFIPVQLNSSDQRFKDLREQLDSTIMRTHSFTSAIAGIEVSGKLGAASEITEQLQYMQSTVISPAQLEIQKAFEKIAKLSGSEQTLTLNKYIIFDNETITKSIEANSTIKKTLSFKLNDK